MISLGERAGVADWMGKYCGQLRYSRATWHLALIIFDKALDHICKLSIKFSNMLMVLGLSATCILIAAKNEEIRTPRVRDLVRSVSCKDKDQGEEVDSDLILNLERFVLQEVLQWRVQQTTLYTAVS